MSSEVLQEALFAVQVAFQIKILAYISALKTLIFKPHMAPTGHYIFAASFHLCVVGHTNQVNKPSFCRVRVWFSLS